jgi:hypothetical protein
MLPIPAPLNVSPISEGAAACARQHDGARQTGETETTTRGGSVYGSSAMVTVRKEDLQKKAQKN